MTSVTILTQCCVVFVGFFGDPDGFMWHMRLLMVRAGGSTWIAATPDHDLELLDLSRHTVIPLRPGELFPNRTADQVYAFDEFEEGEEEGLVRRARDCAAAVGFVTTAGAKAPGTWRLSGAAHTHHQQGARRHSVDRRGVAHGRVCPRSATLGKSVSFARRTP